jgi:hypothetical protein
MKASGIFADKIVPDPVLRARTLYAGADRQALESVSGKNLIYFDYIA